MKSFKTKADATKEANKYHGARVSHCYGVWVVRSADGVLYLNENGFFEASA